MIEPTKTGASRLYIQKKKTIKMNRYNNFMKKSRKNGIYEKKNMKRIAPDIRLIIKQRMPAISFQNDGRNVAKRMRVAVSSFQVGMQCVCKANYLRTNTNPIHA